MLLAAVARREEAQEEEAEVRGAVRGREQLRAMGSALEEERRRRAETQALLQVHPSDVPFLASVCLYLLHYLPCFY